MYKCKILFIMICLWLYYRKYVLWCDTMKLLMFIGFLGIGLMWSVKYKSIVLRCLMCKSERKCIHGRIGSKWQRKSLSFYFWMEIELPACIQQDWSRWWRPKVKRKKVGCGAWHAKVRKTVKITRFQMNISCDTINEIKIFFGYMMGRHVY